MDTSELLAEAIRTRQQVIARYHGEERLFSPHALGTKRGIDHVLAYQFAGGSRSGLKRGGEWRCLRLDDLSDLRLQPGAWHTAPNLFNPQSCLDVVEVVAEPLPPLQADP
jgi:predicted DNA-binding transcriptional regulator YafY